MKNESQIVEDEMRKLITKSCDFDTYGGTFYPFHKTILKYYFSAIDVTIDYSEKLITLFNSKPLTEESYNLYDINEAVAAKVNYTNLEETLKGCLEQGANHNRFYKSLLFHYNNVSREPDTEVMSA
tara:strand:- start:8435 stop:8812 length:378 start_codon:yes stop_codon:yes gene_type:complete